jgi:uncharacterized protein YndB with AHSA1/START domain
MRVQKSTDIAASPDKVWAFLVEPEKVLEWYLPWDRFEYTRDQQGGLGASLYFEERMGARAVGLTCVITEQERIAFEMTQGPLLKSYAERWALEATPPGSRFTLALEAEFLWGIVDTLIGPFAQRSSAANVEKMLAKLKNLAEA